MIVSSNSIVKSLLENIKGKKGTEKYYKNNYL